jgi:hypothetical protein
VIGSPRGRLCNRRYSISSTCPNHFKAVLFSAIEPENAVCVTEFLGPRGRRGEFLAAYTLREFGRRAQSEQLTSTTVGLPWSFLVDLPINMPDEYVVDQVLLRERSPMGVAT